MKKSKMKIRLFKPTLGKSDIKAVQGVFKRSWLGFGPLVNKFEKEWSNQGFMLNVTNDDLMVKNPLGIIPHQDYWEDEAPTMQFGSVIFLNTPD